MRLRSLLPWLLIGALVASAYANFAMYQSRTAAPSARAPLGSQAPGTAPSFHLAPGGSSERCPTLDLLGLTSEQRSKIRKCSLTSLDVRTDLALEISGASEELDALLSRDTIDGEKVLALADRISGLRSQQYRAWIGSILVVREVLTPEQLQLLHKLESN